MKLSEIAQLWECYVSFNFRSLISDRVIGIQRTTSEYASVGLQHFAALSRTDENNTAAEIAIIHCSHRPKKTQVNCQALETGE